MATRMLIDARHPEETRVAVLKGNRIEEFDFESAEHKQIKGNIYLAKVTRVEPSLQAAFVDFGGNRHGFLAFSEIHPDYYQIPAQDRAALIAEEQAAAEEEAALRAEEDDEESHGSDDREGEEDDGSGIEEIDTSDKDHVSTIEDGHVENGDDDEQADESGGADQFDDASDEDAEHRDADQQSEDDHGRPQRGRGRSRGKRQQGRGTSGSRAKEMDEVRARRQALRRRYKIQDVIQRRQVLLVQVVKEERGNKGAALTTYLSLAGRYCVLMPNSSHGGGISRKISSGSDRKRLKQIVSDLSLPRSMGLIVRTAGLQRTKTEIKRDFDYLARLWDEIRERTLGSSAPAVIHSDSDLIKRAIRDIYNREIEEVVVEGEEGYKAAKQFMKLLMPSHARRVKHYADPVPLFQRYGAEDQLSAMYDPMVQLKSGGYLVINPTEALVSIDINSGRSTKEHGIEQTAVATNLEAAREIARQLRLRDMAGLVVIDFIDMEHSSNIRKVERAMKDALKNDRARIQVGRISGFGLMEMSRQRLRTGVLEATTRDCPHCDGTGLVRTASSAGLSALRLIEDEAAKGKGTLITLYASTEAAVYLLNAKRADLAEIERVYGVLVEVRPEGEDEGAKMRVSSSGPRPAEAPRFDPIIEDDGDEYDLEGTEDEEDEDDSDQTDERGSSSARVGEDRSGEDRSSEDDPRRKRRRRRRGRDKAGEQDRREENESATDEETETSGEREENASRDGDDDDKPRRRRRRGGRGRKRRQDEGAQTSEDGEAPDPEEAGEAVGAKLAAKQVESAEATEAGGIEVAPEASDDEPGPQEKPKRRSRRKKVAETEAEGSEAASSAAVATDAAPAQPESAPEAAKPKRRSRARKATPDEGEDVAANAGPIAAAEAAEEVKTPRSRRKKPAAAKSAPATEPAAEAAPAQTQNEPAATEEQPAANGANESSDEAHSGGDGGQRRGWWQRTFGA